MKKGFTLIEIIVVVVLVATIAGFAIQQYGKTVEVAEARNAILLARTIQAAEEMYLAKHGHYWPLVDGSYTIDDINRDLNLHLDSGRLYVWCDNDPVSGYSYPVYDCCLFYPQADYKWKYEMRGNYKYPASWNYSGTAPIPMPVCLKSDPNC